MASVELRLTRLEGALGRREERPGQIVMVGADGIARGPGGVAVDLATLTTPPGGPRSVVLIRGLEPPPPDPDRR